MVTEIVEPDRSMVTAPGSFPQRRVHLVVTEALTGLPPSTKEVVVETGLGGGDCGYGFQRGRDYIVYASPGAGGAYQTGICSPTRPLADAAEDLKYFHQLATAPPVGEIHLAAFDPQRARGTLELPGVRVTIEGPGGPQTATTGAGGRCTFTNLPPGKYTVAASLDSYTPFAEVRPLNVPAKGCATAVVLLTLDRTVGGRVVTPAGLPAAGVMVEAVPVRPRYPNDLPMPSDSSTTDSAGRYSLRNLTAGDYYIGISIGRSPTQAQPYTRWFYPGTEDPSLAGILHVSDRPESQSFDLTVPHPQQERIIEGTVYRQDGVPAQGVYILLEDPRWSWQTSTVAAVTDQAGHFRVNALDGTRYRLHAGAPRFPIGPASAEPTPIEPGKEPLNLHLILTRKDYLPIDRSGLDHWRKGLGLR
jgi:hypothetical protein